MVPTFGRTPGLRDFFSGLSLPFKAIGVVTRSGKLALLSLLSSVVTLGVLVALVTILVRYSDDALGSVWARPEAWYGAGLWYVVLALGFLLALVVGANTLPLLLLAPLQDPISEATEEACGGLTAPAFSVGQLARGTAVSLTHTVKRIAILLAGQLLLLPLHLIPGAGNIIATVLGTLWTIAWLAGEYLSGPMARHLYPFSDVRRALLARKALALGFGAAIFVMLWVPVLNFFFIPLAIVGGTLLYRGLVACGQIAPSA
jgi:CysZ protein